MAQKVNNQETILSSEDKKAISALGEVKNPKQGEDYYLENGLLVMTRWFLLRRGYCCENGCRHCPYSEQAKSISVSLHPHKKA